MDIEKGCVEFLTFSANSCLDPHPLLLLSMYYRTKCINMTKIYYLHGGDNIPTYIGKTILSPKKRLHQHRSKKSQSHLQIEVIDEVPSEEWRFWEEFYIILFKSWGFTLVNKNNGGCGPSFVSQQTRDKISKSLKGKIKPEEFGKKIGEKNRGQKRSKEFCDLQRNIHLGMKRTDEFKAHMSKLWKEKQWKPSPSQINSIKESNSIPVLQFDLEGNFIQEFFSQVECSIQLGINKNSINNVLRGVSQTAGGYIFKYKNK